MSTINERFREAREALNLSQEDFAQKAHRTRSELKNIEYGKTVPKDPVIWSVCEAHGINELWLRTGEGEMFSATAEEDAITAVLSSAIGHADTEQQRFIRAVAKIPPEYIPAVTQAALAYIKAMYPEALKDLPPDSPYAEK